MRPRLLSRWGTAGVLAATALGVLAAPASATTVTRNSSGPAVLYREDFTGQDTAQGEWISKSTGGKYVPCLTAADRPASGGIPQCIEATSGARKPDAVGSGVFEITPNTKGESGFGLFTRPLQTDKGIQVDFDFYQRDAKLYDDGMGKRGGDGIAFFLIDGAASPAAAGDAGGSLGYRNLPGGLIGLGFDEFGNFSDPKWGGTGGPGERPDSVVLRGAATTGYRFITGKKSPYPLAVDGAVQRGPAKRHVTIDLSTKNELRVYINFLNGKGPRLVLGPIDLNKVKGQPPLPPSIKFGFAAATGLATAFHEIQGMKITSLPPDLRLAVSHSGTFKAGGTGSFELAVTNDASAGPTTGPASVQFRVPDGLIPQTPSGPGWNCSVAGQVVTCTRTDTLNNGAAYPPIAVPVAVAGQATGTLTATGAVSDPDDTGTAGKHVTDSVTIGALSPDLSLSMSHSGTFSPGGTGTYTISVADKPGAGPASGPTTVVFPVPDGMTPVSAAGPGWNCTINGQTVTCGRTDALQPGSSFPPLNVNVSVAPGTSGQIPATVTASSPGDVNPQNVTATDTVTVAPLPPDLSMAVAAGGPFQAGGSGSFTLTTANAAAAGPTTGTVTNTFQVPAGLTVRSAEGTGWQCSISGQVVTCTRPGSGADALSPGSAYPPVKVTVDIPGTASGQATATATASTPGDTGTPAETAHSSVNITPLAPDLAVTVTAPPVVAGDPATATVVATDKPGAGPVTGPTTVGFTAPPGYTVTTADGSGWQCSINGQVVTCTRPDALQPGNSFPPVTITMATPASAHGPVPVTATAQTAGQPSASPGTGTLQVKALAPRLVVGLGDQGKFTAGQSGGAYLISVGADQAAGPVTGPVTVTFPMPGSPAMTPGSASGDGWNCTTSAHAVTCKRADPLPPGGTYPPITVPVAVPPALSGPVHASVTASTGQVSAQGSDVVTIGQLAPSVTVAVTAPDGGITAGGSGTYTIVASDAPHAGPTTGPTTITFSAPAPQTVVSAAGDGWNCSVSGHDVTCSRPDPLQPGASFPPVRVVVAIPGDATGAVTSTTQVGTPGNGSPVTGAATEIPVIPLPPDPTLSVGCKGSADESVHDGSVIHICVNVGDQVDAGAVTEPVTVDLPDPAGMTPDTAGGNGWNCADQNSQDGFVCVSTGDLTPGQMYPPIDASWQVSGDMTGAVPVDATVYTPGEVQPGGIDASCIVQELPAPARVSADVVDSGPVPAGGTEDLTVNVADAADAGPVSSNVNIRVAMPAQLHPTSVYGDGWDCIPGWDAVSCQRASGLAGLRPGAEYPPITISDSASARWGGGRIRATAAALG
jgi:hypothetical protein